MNIQDNNSVDNPSEVENHSDRQTPQEIADGLKQLADRLLASVPEAVEQGESFDQVERRAWKTVIQLGDQTMQLFLSLQGGGDLGQRVVTDDGKTLPRSETKSTTPVRSIFGKHSFEQYTYSPGKNKTIELRPISVRIALPEHRWSFLLQEFSQMFCVDQAFKQSSTNLSTVLGGKFSIDTLEKINQQIGEQAGEYLDDLPNPDPNTEAKFLVAQADGKGVPLIKKDIAKVAAFETAKKRPGNRKMATVASVYTVDPHIRTAENVTEALFREIPEPTTSAADSENDSKQALLNADLGLDDKLPKRPGRPKPQNKNTTAHFPTSEDNGDGKEVAISGIHVAVAWIVSQITLRRRPGQVLLVLMDGQASLWDTIALHLTFGKRTIGILDILHALAYVWEAAGLFCSTESERKAFTRSRLLRILRGEVAGVIRGLRQMGTRRDLKGDKLKTLKRICGYLEKNQDRMRYDEYLRRGYPIATGVIEGACRHLVKDRMERSGMRWTLAGARNMLNVRAAFQSDHWRPFLDSRIQEQTAVAQQHRNLIADYTPLTLSC